MAALTKEQALANARARLAQKKASQTQMPSGQTEIERILGRTARSAVSGAGSLADLPRIATDPLLNALGYGIEQFAPETGRDIRNMSHVPLLGDTMRQDFDVATGNRYAPITPQERIADRASEFMFSAGAGGALARGVKSLPKAAKFFLDEGGVAGLAVAGGAGAGEEYARQNEVNPLVGALAGGVGGGLAVGGVQGIAKSGIGGDESGALRLPSKNTDSNNLSRAERTVARLLIDEQGLNPTQAARQVRAAGTGQVPLTLPERVGNQTLIKMQQRLAESPSKAGKVLGDFGIERQKTALPNAYEDFVRSVTDGATSSPVAAGGKVKAGAQSVVDKAVAKRKWRSEPYYDLAGLQILSDDQMQSVRQSSPIFDGIMNKILNNDVYMADIGDAPLNSVKTVDYTKKAIDDMIDNAIRSGDKNKARILKQEKDKIINAIDSVSPAYAHARKIFAKNSPRVNKLNENIVGMLAKVKEGQPQKALSILTQESPASINYARRTIGKINPDAWNSIVGAHFREVAEKNNYSPTKMLNAMSDKTASGNVIRSKRLDAMLDPQQRRAKNVFFEYMNRAQRVKFGSNTATNLQADEIMQGALGKGADTAQQVIEQGLRGDKAGLAKRAVSGVFDWYDERIRSGNYEELAKIFVGQGSEDFAEKISKINPKDLRGMSEIIGERIAEVSRASAQTTRISGTQSALRQTEQQPTQSGKPAPVLPTADILKKREEAIRKARERLKMQQSQQPTITQAISPQSSYFEMPLGEGASFTQVNEGFSPVRYNDSLGNPTIGYGFNFDSGIAPRVWKEAGIQTPYKQAKLGKAAITPQEAQALYQTHERIAIEDARNYYPDFDRLRPQQQIALIDMSYQMGGNTLNQFAGLKKALKSNNKNAIIRSIRTSNYHTQTPERAERVLRMLVTEDRK